MTATTQANTEYRYDGAPLNVGAPRTNFLALDTLDHRKKSPVLTSRFLTGTVPALIAAGAIIALAIIRYAIALDQGRAADIHLLEVKTTARYPLATRELVQERSAIVKQTADQIVESANGVTPNLATLVNVANVLPINIRVKSVNLDPARATITNGEALDYNAIVSLSEKLAKVYPTTIATAALGADPSSGMGATDRANTWRWTGYINLATPAPTNSSGTMQP
jgi:hypothetical protein